MAWCRPTISPPPAPPTSSTTRRRRPQARSPPPPLADRPRRPRGVRPLPRQRRRGPRAPRPGFEAISAHMTAQGHGAGWSGWPEDLRDPTSPAVADFARAHSDDVGFHAWLQWLADRQLGEARDPAFAAGMRLGLYLDFASANCSTARAPGPTPTSPSPASASAPRPTTSPPPARTGSSPRSPQSAWPPPTPPPSAR